MKYVTLVNSLESLKMVANTDLKMSKAIEMAKFINEVNDEVNVYKELEEKLARKYGSEEEGRIVIDEDKLEAFNNEYAELKAQDIENFICPKLSYDDLPKDAENIKPVHLVQLKWLFEPELEGVIDNETDK